MLRALYSVLNHDISSRVCDAALSIIECLLQLGVPGKNKWHTCSDNKENAEARSRDGTNVRTPVGVMGEFGVGPDGGGGGGDGGGGDGRDSRDNIKNNKQKVCAISADVVFLCVNINKRVQT